jgi:N-methylhydantoinase A/oxoprolinase/acetone carboxylase beta subunit
MIAGPAIIEEPGSTIWVASGMSGEVDRYGNFVITTDVSGALARDAELVQEA